MTLYQGLSTVNHHTTDKFHKQGLALLSLSYRLAGIRRTFAKLIMRSERWELLGISQSVVVKVDYHWLDPSRLRTKGSAKPRSQADGCNFTLKLHAFHAGKGATHACHAMAKCYSYTIL
jgi:hypothetical protein